MNILIFSWRDLKHPLAGGAEESTHQHAKAWVKNGHKVTLFTSRFKASKAYAKIDGVEIIRHGHEVFGVHISAFFWYCFGSHSKFDLVVDQFHGIPFFTPLYVRAKKLAFIHEVAKEVWKLNPWPKPFNLLPGVFGTIFEPLIFKIFYRKVPFMTVSQSTKKDLIDWGIPSENVDVIHNGVTLTLPLPVPNREKRKTAIYLGALAKDKGIEEAIESFNLINKSDRNWQFWVVGKGDEKYKKKLEIRCQRLGIEEKVKFWGYVSDKKKFELLVRAHVLINPSAREGWGLVNIEANAVGTPIVAYNVPGIRDSVKDGFSGRLCEEKTPECLAKEILSLVNDKARFKKLSRQAKTWSKKFNWKTSTQKSLRLLQSF